MAILEAILVTFPFVIHGVHADNGSASIHHRVAARLNPHAIACTKSRPRHSQDNVRAASKHARVIRKPLGYDPIPGHGAPQLHDVHREPLNPYLTTTVPAGSPSRGATTRAGSRNRTEPPWVCRRLFSLS